jgi:hypothetical protein
VRKVTVVRHCVQAGTFSTSVVGTWRNPFVLPGGGDVLARCVEGWWSEWESACALWCGATDLPLCYMKPLVCVGSQWSSEEVHVREGDCLASQKGCEKSKRPHFGTLTKAGKRVTRSFSD